MGKTFGTDENTFVDILTGHSLEQCKQIAQAYEQNHGSSLDKAIKSEFSGVLEDALCFLLQEPLDIFCVKLQKATAGLGTDEEMVNRIIGGNEKETIVKLIARFKQKYDQNLVELLDKELSGDYRNAVVTYMTTRDATDGIEAINRDARELMAAQAASVAAPAASIPVASVPAPTVALKVATVAAPPPAPQFSEPPAVAKCWAEKEGHFFTNWKRRFFVITSSPSATILVYYENESPNKPYGTDEKGTIDITNYRMNVSGDIIHLTGPGDAKDMKMKIDFTAERERMKAAIQQHLDYRAFRKNGK